MNARSSVQAFLTLFRLMLTVSLLVRGNWLHSDEPAIPMPVPEGNADSNGSADEATPSKDANRPVNRLSRESSPYLLMHAHNPIQWFPWGPEAFEKARAEDKPVFLSIGYSSCYWCHVMEREVFSSDRIAEYMNTHFVCIKVDREERPDVDDLYMTSLIVYQQAAGSGGGGGWPLSLFLDNEGNPIAGATYLPPEDTPDGRTGFLTAATRIQDLWKNQRESVLQTSSMIAREVRRLSGPTVLAEPVKLDAELLKAVTAAICQNYDEVWGGVDLNRRRPDGPRFPSVPRLMFLLQQFRETQDPQLMSIVRHSLTAMARGGIRDHLGGGFHRYSTERTWTVPHFEKMLYDQAQLLEIYSQVTLQNPDPLYGQVIDELVSFLRREMLLPEGAFCSALDAETHAIEGEFYVWTEAEIREHLKGDEADQFLKTYGFSQPQSFEHGRILYLPEDPGGGVTASASETASLGEVLTECRHRLLAVRAERERPFLDDKVLTEWNGLMIQALAVSGRLPGREADLQLAERAAEFLLTRLRDKEGALVRSWRNGVQGPKAYLDDYASLVSALLTLHQSTKNERWLTSAQELTQKQLELFYDENLKTFFFTSESHEKLFARTSSPYDSVSPSGNSVAIRNLLYLSDRKPEYRELAAGLLRRFSGTIESAPASCAGLALAARDFLKSEESSGADTSGSRRGWETGPVRLAALTRDDLGHIAGSNQSRGIEGPWEPNGRLLLTRLDETEGNQKKPAADKPVKAKIYTYFNKLPRGGRCPVAIEVTIADGWHINANPASADYLIPTEVRVKSPQKVKLTKIKYPKHEEHVIAGEEKPLFVYGRKVLIYGVLEVDPAEEAGEAEVNVEIRYQACKGDSCEPPNQVRLTGKLKIAQDETELQKVNEEKFPQ
jgi:uncharacterized protein YyaL (SSP411 family)